VSTEINKPSVTRHLDLMNGLQWHVYLLGSSEKELDSFSFYFRSCIFHSLKTSP